MKACMVKLRLDEYHSVGIEFQCRIAYGMALTEQETHSEHCFPTACSSKLCQNWLHQLVTHTCTHTFMHTHTHHTHTHIHAHTHTPPPHTHTHTHITHTHARVHTRVCTQTQCAPAFVKIITMYNNKITIISKRL